MVIYLLFPGNLYMMWNAAGDRRDRQTSGPVTSAKRPPRWTYLFSVFSFYQIMLQGSPDLAAYLKNIETKMEWTMDEAVTYLMNRTTG